MRIIPIDSNACSEANIARFLLEVEAHEVEQLEPDPSALTNEFQDGSVRLEGKIKRTELATKFLFTTVEDCEECALDIPESSKDCPNKATLQFIRDVIL